jgi:hypothetical protein
MKYFLILFVAVSTISCQKENETPETLFTAYDSIVGYWNYDHEYLLISLESNPTVVIDSPTVDYYAPYSYFKINSDSSYRWWATASIIQPGPGYGVSGKIVAINTSREMLKSHVTYSNDNFLTETVFDPVGGIREKIKILTNNRMVLVFTIRQNDGRLFNWHRVFLR